MARAQRSGAGAFPLSSSGGGWVRQGAASSRARCRAYGGPEHGLAAQRSAGAVQRSPATISGGREVRPERRRRGGRSALTGAQRQQPLMRREDSWRASGRGLETPARVAGSPCPMVSLRIQGRGRRIGTAWRMRRTTRLVGDARIGPCALRIATTRLEGEGDVVKKLTARLNVWAEAHRQFHLSDLHVQMARELGVNLKQCGGLATHRQEPWNLPPPGVHCVMLPSTVSLRETGKGAPLAKAAKRQQQSTRDTADTHKNAQTHDWTVRDGYRRLVMVERRQRDGQSA